MPGGFSRNAVAVAMMCVATCSCEAESTTAPFSRPANMPTSAPTSRPAFTLSRETSFFPGPVRPDGTIDYLAALNAKCDAEVSAGNNAAALVAQMIEPRAFMHPDDQQAMLDGLGVKPVGPYFVRLLDVAMEQAAAEALAAGSEPAEQRIHEILDGLLAQQGQAVGRAWEAKDFPALSAWLDRNAASLAALQQASRMPMWYMPLVASEEPALLYVSAPSYSVLREAAGALATRASLSIGQGQFEAALGDLSAIDRLSTLLAQGPSLGEQLYAHTLSRMSDSARTQLAEALVLSAAQAKAMLADINARQALPNLVHATDAMERSTALDATMFFMRQDAQELSQTLEVHAVPPAEAKRAAGRGLQWDRVLREINGIYDQRADVLGPANYRGRIQRARSFHKTLMQTEQRLAATLPATSQDASAALDVESRLAYGIALPMVSADLSRAVDVHAQTDTAIARAKIALALAACRAEHGTYPAALTDLPKSLLPQLPPNPYTGEPPVYKLDGEGYSLEFPTQAPATGSRE